VLFHAEGLLNVNRQRACGSCHPTQMLSHYLL
jgi:hypothetical protein